MLFRESWYWKHFKYNQCIKFKVSDNRIDDDIFDEYDVLWCLCSIILYAVVAPIRIYLSIYLYNHRILIYISSSTLPPTVPSTGAVQAEAVSIPEASAASDTTTNTNATTTTTTTHTVEGNEDNGDWIRYVC